LYRAPIAYIAESWRLYAGTGETYAEFAMLVKKYHNMNTFIPQKWQIKRTEYSNIKRSIG